MKINVKQLRLLIKESMTRWSEPTFTRSYGEKDHDLRDDFSNAYWLVLIPVKVWVYTGKTKPSNHYYGNANIASQELRELTLNPGDELHALASGLFAVRDGKAYEVNVDTPLRLKRSGYVQNIDRTEATRIKSYRSLASPGSRA